MIIWLQFVWGYCEMCANILTCLISFLDAYWPLLLTIAIACVFIGWLIKDDVCPPREAETDLYVETRGSETTVLPYELDYATKERLFRWYGQAHERVAEDVAYALGEIEYESF